LLCLPEDAVDAVATGVGLEAAVVGPAGLDGVGTALLDFQRSSSASPIGFGAGIDLSP
jgi:hypothetical protein